MSLYDYHASREILKTDPPFYALIMAAMARADTPNGDLLRASWPHIWDEAQARYNAPGAILPSDNAAPPFDPVHEIPMYQARCTSCGLIVDDYRDFSGWSERDMPIEVVVDHHGWKRNGDTELLCPNCQGSSDE